MNVREATRYRLTRVREPEAGHFHRSEALTPDAIGSAAAKLVQSYGATGDVAGELKGTLTAFLERMGRWPQWGAVVGLEAVTVGPIGLHARINAELLRAHRHAVSVSSVLTFPLVIDGAQGLTSFTTSAGFVSAVKSAVPYRLMRGALISQAGTNVGKLSYRIVDGTFPWAQFDAEWLPSEPLDNEILADWVRAECAQNGRRITLARPVRRAYERCEEQS